MPVGQSSGWDSNKAAAVYKQQNVEHISGKREADPIWRDMNYMRWWTTDDDTERAKELAVSIPMSAPMSDDRGFQVLEAVPNQLGAPPQRPRRRWSAQAKARLIEESQAGLRTCRRSRARLGWRLAAVWLAAQGNRERCAHVAARRGSARLAETRRQRLRWWRSSSVASVIWAVRSA